MGVHGDLGWALSTILREYGRRADCLLADLPGAARGYRLLSAVVHDCPRSQLALAQHVGLDRTVVTYLIDDLEAAALLERQADPADRRTRRIVATDAGRAQLLTADTALANLELGLLAGLGEDERRQVRTLLSRAAAYLAHDAGIEATPPDVHACEQALSALVPEPVRTRS